MHLSFQYIGKVCDMVDQVNLKVDKIEMLPLSKLFRELVKFWNRHISEQLRGNVNPPSYPIFDKLFFDKV